MELKSRELATGEPRKGFAGREPLTDMARAREARIVMVYCDSQFEASHQMLEEMSESFGLPPLTSMNLSGFISSPSLSADMLLIGNLSPQDILARSTDLEEGIRAFRANNAPSAVVLQSVYGSGVPAGLILREMAQAGLVTLLEGAGIGPHRMIEAGAEALARNAL